MLLVAGEPVQRLGQDYVDLTGSHGSLQGLVARALTDAAGEGGIVEFANDTPALALGVGATDSKLIVD